MPMCQMETEVAVLTSIDRLDEPSQDLRLTLTGFKKATVLKTNLRLVDSHRSSKFYQILDLFHIEGTEQQAYWNKCACNELDALNRRHYPDDLPELFAPTDNLQVLYVKNWRLFIDRLIDTQPYTRVSHTEFMASCRPHIKKRYQNAYQQIRERRTIFGSNQARVNLFIKFEKIPLGKFEDGKAPRGIQFRDFTYMYAFKRAFLPITRAIKACDGRNVFGQRINSMFTKNMLGKDIANNMFEAWMEFKKPVGVCLDHSNWDGHYARPLMNVSNYMWNKYATHGYSRKRMTLLERLLSEQFVTRGASPNGLHFKASGKRCSGEYTTSDENGSANKHILESVFELIILDALKDGSLSGSFGDWKINIFVNGDDSVVMMEHELWLIVEKRNNWLSLFRRLNQETKMDGEAAYRFEEISYCQASPVQFSGGWRMVKTPLRYLSRAAYTDKFFTEKTLLRYYRSLGLCELAVSAGVPILQTFALRLLELAQGARPLGNVDKVQARSFNQAEIRFQPVTMQTRLSFEIAFGISVSRQLQIERMISGRNYNSIQATNLIGKYSRFHLN